MSIWTDFVRAYAKKHKITYPEAMRKAGPEYRKKYGSGVSGAGKKKKAKGGMVKKRAVGGSKSAKCASGGAKSMRKRRIVL